jgi:hypothetical protein
MDHLDPHLPITGGDFGPKGVLGPPEDPSKWPISAKVVFLAIFDILASDMSGPNSKHEC